MKTIIQILIVLAFLIYASNPKINFKPFSISFESPYTPFAIFFLVLSIALFQVQADKKGYKKGMEDLYNEIVKRNKD